VGISTERDGLVLVALQLGPLWTGGRHSEISWREGAYLHFAFYSAKERTL
jgi:hypothetical protein